MILILHRLYSKLNSNSQITEEAYEMPPLFYSGFELTYKDSKKGIRK